MANDLLDQIRNLQATTTARPFGVLPLELLEAFEQLSDGPQKDYLRHKYIENLRSA